LDSLLSASLIISFKTSAPAASGDISTPPV
jgi:hypothetical protein